MRGCGVDDSATLRRCSQPMLSCVFIGVSLTAHLHPNWVTIGFQLAFSDCSHRRRSRFASSTPPAMPTSWWRTCPTATTTTWDPRWPPSSATPDGTCRWGCVGRRVSCEPPFAATLAGQAGHAARCRVRCSLLWFPSIKRTFEDEHEHEYQHEHVFVQNASRRQLDVSHAASQHRPCPSETKQARHRHRHRHRQRGDQGGRKRGVVGNRRERPATAQGAMQHKRKRRRGIEAPVTERGDDQGVMRT